MTPDDCFNHPVSDRADFSARLDQFHDVFDYATHRFGSQNEVTRLIGARLSELEQEQAALEARPKTQAERQADMLGDGLMKSPALLVGLGVAMAAAISGLSTLFIGMLAAKWLTF
jgi:hypothetical protein